MSPLIEIKTVPIEIEMRVSSAKLEYSRGTADLEISKGTSGVQIKSSSIRLNMDTFQSSNTVMPNVTGSGGGAGHAVYQATASYTQQGQQLLLNAHISQGAAATQATQSTKATQAAAQPVIFAAGGGSSQLDTAEMNIRFEMDKLNFDWRSSQLEFEFTPGDIEISVTQQPDVVITYVGGPIYVPRSSDPNYEPVDVHA